MTIESVPSTYPPNHKNLLKDLDEIDKDLSMDGKTKRIHAVLAVENHCRDLDQYYAMNPNKQKAPITERFCKYVNRLTKYDDKTSLVPIEVRHHMLLACAQQFGFELWNGELPNFKKVVTNESLPPKKKRKRQDRWVNAKTTYCRSLYAGQHNLGPLAAMAHSHETQNNFQVTYYGCKMNGKKCDKESKCPFQARLFFKSPNGVKLKDYSGEVAVQQLQEHTCTKRNMTWTDYLKDPSMRGLHPLVKEAAMMELSQKKGTNCSVAKPSDVVRKVAESFPEVMTKEVTTQIENLTKRETYKSTKGVESRKENATPYIEDIVSETVKQHLSNKDEI